MSQWLKAARAGGREALRRRPRGRRAPGLTAKQRVRLPALLAEGAEAYGSSGDVWTTARVAEVIRREFGVRHHPAHVSRILKSIAGRSRNRSTGASQRNEAAITAFREERLPALQAKPSRRSRPSSSSTRPGSTPSRL